MDAGIKKESKPNPRVTASPLSLLVFGWVLEIFRVGYKKDLEVNDLYDALDEHRSDYLGSKLEKLWNVELEKARTKTYRPSLLWVLIKCFGPYTMVLGLVLACVELICQVLQPFFLGGLIRYFAQDSHIPYETAVLYASCIILCTLFNIFMRHPYSMGIFHTGMKMRVGLCSLIYRKALKLSKTALGETTVGQVVNLLSNDVNRFDVSVLFLAYTWIGPIETVIMTYLMWQQIGYAALVGVATLFLLIPLQAYFGKLISILRLRIAKRTDQRIRFMNEIIVGIQVIKMYAWEKPFAHMVSLARKREIRAVRLSSYVRGMLFSFGKFGTKVAIFVSMVTHFAMGGSITPEKMFVVVAYFNVIKYSMVEFLPMAITQLSEASVSVKRIQTFLLYDEVEHHTPTNAKPGKMAITNNSPENGAAILKSVKLGENVEKSDDAHKKMNDSLEVSGGIRIEKVTAKWMEDLNENTLTGVNIDIERGALVAVIGPVGSGKTSLLHAILKELPLSSGSIMVGGSISYASQEPWLFSGSICKNILFGQPMNRKRYKEVVRVCALEQDFDLLPHRDKTIVGERGVTLSGGQRARINLARAIYKEADIYLLDDPLSAVDTHVGRHLFEDCICEFLQNKTRLLVTHQLQYLQSADNIVILNNGIVEATGTFTELQESGLDFAKQLAVGTEEHEEVEQESETESLQSSYKLARQLSETSLHTPMRQISESSAAVDASEPEILAERRSRGSVNSRVYRAYCAAGGNCGVTILVFGVCVLSQIALSAGDYWMSFWSNVEQRRNHTTVVERENKTFSSYGDNNTLPSFDNFTTLLSLDNFTTFASLKETTTFQNEGSVDDVTQWTTEACIFVYSCLLAAVVVLVFGSSLIFYTVCMRASVRLHDAMFNSITRATMWFFNNNPSGQILNRFAKDMGSVDESLPMTMNDCVQIGLQLIGVVLVVAVVNFWLLIPTAIMFAFFYLLRVYYVSTSRSVKRLEGITRSPVFSHINASLQGLTTIRAFGAQKMLEKEFDSHQDLHSSAWFMFIASSRAFGLWLDISCLFYISLVTISFLFVGKDLYGGDVGLAITQAIGLTGMLQWGMRQSAELENNMTSLERILEYTNVESESPLESLPGKKPDENWPSEGEIVFNDVVLAYSENDPAILKGVCFSVLPSEKVGIVGRTGAGKSSLITSLFRLVELSGGSIKIDGIDLSTIGLHDLRSKISIIPQEPALFSGLLRENLDPFEQYSDAVLWSALEEVELKQAVEELPAGLSHKVSEGGSNFSVGQRQLLCLARAIIRNNKILVMDEATANVDPQTDELIQATIRRKFANCTLLTIAHRLHTVMDSDRIIVMDAGSVVEFGHPYILLQNENGFLYQMVEQTGHAMAESLFKIAKTCYERRS